MSLHQDSASAILPPTKSILTNPWDVDRFIVLGSVEKLVAVFFCPYLEQIDKGITRIDASSSKQGDAATRIHQERIRESGLMKSTLDSIAMNISKYCSIFYVDTAKVTEFDNMYELFADEPFALLFFYKNKHIKVDVATGNNNKVNFPIMDRDEAKQLFEAVMLGAKTNPNAAVNTGMDFSLYAGRGQ